MSDLTDSLTSLYSTMYCRPEVFKNAIMVDRNENLQAQNNQPEEEEVDSSEDDGLPPLEANTNRTKPLILQPDAESESDSDS